MIGGGNNHSKWGESDPERQTSRSPLSVDVNVQSSEYVYYVGNTHKGLRLLRNHEKELLREGIEYTCIKS